jgi:hypothetical protein
MVPGQSESCLQEVQTLYLFHHLICLEQTPEEEGSWWSVLNFFDLCGSVNEAMPRGRRGVCRRATNRQRQTTRCQPILLQTCGRYEAAA